MLSVRLLGGIALELDGEALPPPGGRCGSLLAWLAMHPGMQPRAMVAARLWPDVLDESARRSLRTALLDLRRALGSEAGRHLLATRDEVGLGPADEVRVDTRAFAAAVAAGRLDEALAYAQGELLPELEHDWVYEARDAHRQAVADVLERLADAAERRGDLPTAVDRTHRLVAVDRLDERHARALIRRLAAADDRAGALAAFARHRDVLRTELAVAPAAATRALVAEIRADADAADARPVTLPTPLVAQSAKPLFGRAAEIEAAIARRRRAVAGGGLQCVVVAGEPGMGKTRLLAEVCRRLHTDAATVLYGRCHEDAPLPYAPFVEALRGYVADASPERVAHQAGAGVAQLAKLVPQLAEHADVDAAPAGADPGIDAMRLFDAVTSLLTSAARPDGLVLALDDLHWADRQTLRLLDHVARTATEAPILVLGSYRDTEVPEGHRLRDTLARLDRERTLARVSLAGLGEPAVAALAGVSAPDSLPPDLVHAVFETTGGNPYFVEELIRDLGRVAQPDARSPADVLGEVGVPESIRELVGRRLGRLSEDARAIVSAAAVFGPEFDVQELGRVTEVAEEPLIDALEEAVTARVVVELPREPGSFAFAHALVRETLYGRLSTVRRARLHARVATAIEERHAARLEDHLPALARHHELAGDASGALRYHRLAGDAAVRVHAADDALEHYTRALSAAARLGLGDDAPDVYRLRHARAGLRQRAGDLSGAIEDGELAVAGARAAGDARVEVDALNRCGFIRRFYDFDGAVACHDAALSAARAAGDAAAETATLARLSMVYANQLRLDESIACANEALAIAADDEAVAVALDAVKLAALQLGDLALLDRTTARLLDLHRRAGEAWALHWLDDWVLLERAFVPIARARWEEALAAVDEAIAANRRFCNRCAEPIFHDALAWIHRSRGDHARAIELGGAAVELAEALANAEWTAWTNATLGWTLLEAGDAARAADHLERGLAAAEATGAHAQLLRCTSLLAWAAWELGERDRAVRLADRADALVAGITAPPGRTFLLGAHAPLAVARVRLAAGAPDAAIGLLAPVLAAARDSGWVETVCSASLLQGECLAALGERAAGGAAIEDGLELARAAGLAWLEREAQHRLRGLTAAPR